MNLETPEDRIKALKFGLSSKDIENIYLYVHEIKIVNIKTYNELVHVGNVIEIPVEVKEMKV